MSTKFEFETRSIHSGLERDELYGATSLPIYETAAFAYQRAEDLEAVFAGRKPGYIYSRINNPTVAAFERRINSLEEGLGAIATASGMAAIATTVGTLTQSGDEIIASKSLFGGTLQFFNEVLASNGIKTVYVDPTDIEAYRRAFSSKTRLVFVETIGNPKLDIPDLRAIARLANENNVPLVVDSTLTTPYLLEAKKFGVNIVIHSTSKYIAGSGQAIGGILVDLGNFNWRNSKSELLVAMTRQAGEFAFLARARKQILQNTGSCLAPFNAFLQNLGLETLALRMKQHCENALRLAEFLKTQDLVGVNYPGLPEHAQYQLAKEQYRGFGAMITIRLGSKERCFEVINRFQMVKQLANVGDAKTLVIHPASTIFHTYSEAEQETAGVYPDLIRISVGIENIKDIIDDFEQALTGR
ncbi:MAG TPA: aminotransferase class I/II-fold pyridoxal phosphate-dependent enzyme [Bacillota bacterium]|nr:aminotransferase class I/II-fold pyridoxal phosphate-dependent enzyme [Bacillota bacterium]HOL09708.1 aminotransferase class I/II-fold pyridoxal phosphate-dependent enzyme [Bacillota bacterium]HPO97297.1 aminotransferase class I/II-fold pyridoxal phosphate-dependent enzyme [Bacillota bacterium]